ncbi:hypothetical protein [Bacteroides fragilis]|uniref:Uncharacterized protein n=1 Tax=Bacteroides fragilis TaxID=817 RepID=A0A853PR68_BACFG|nr:hypothetical protein [Bacteroides fragilis]EYA37311.1 hypothetical protein M075_4170 [Bacteroides fragilis str. 20793-3]MCE9184237.1 hypothetical protein [Bacteroides fragilis]OCR27873.1 hypothetical protein AC094_40590 [Bacteroides fragilis]PJY65465.1 hypothetical protein CQW35_02671 [Bacteroides fragilis]
MVEVNDFISKNDIWSIMKADNVPNICGCIMYTVANPNIIKVLRDTDYWQCFDFISNKWPIFALKPKPELLLEYMVGVPMTNNNYKLFLDFFALKEEDIPCFILFAQINENEINSYRIKLDDSNSDKVFNDLREIILNISKTESFIYNEYKKGTGIYTQAKASLESVFLYKKITRSLNIFSFIKGLFA